MQSFVDACNSVKHLNPRQGITTNCALSEPAPLDLGVKHLNPRQGITTSSASTAKASLAWAV